MSPRARHAHRLLAASLVTLIAVAGCGPDAARSENPSKGPDSTRSGGASGQGAGGMGSSGAGGGSGGAGGAGGAGNTSTPGAGGSPGGAGDGGAAVPAGPVVNLPIIVTRQFDNQGWFADPALEAKFMAGSTIIRHGVATAGPCGPGRTMPAPAGDCLKVTYTPPPDVVPPAEGGWVGVFMLTTLFDPSVIGQPNWGLSGEPGKNIAPGATKISFLAAADIEGQRVVFKAGTKSDIFIIQDVPQTLSTAWRSFSIPLTMPYGNNVYGGFAWVLTDTTKPATFYIDGIVWE
jgi:hypothetical protein